jgi:hypothetical protein
MLQRPAKHAAPGLLEVAVTSPSAPTTAPMTAMPWA